MQLLYGKVQLIASCKERPDGLIVVFSDQKSLLAAIAKFKEMHDYDATESILPVPGVHAVLLPKTLPLTDTPAKEPLPLLPEADYLIRQGRAYKIPFVETTSFASLIERTRPHFDYIRNKQSFLTFGHSRN